MKAEDVVAAARSLVGTPFHHQGRIPGVALDCAGTIIETLKLIGINPIDRTDYGHDPCNGQLEAQIAMQDYVVPVRGIRPGDFLVMSFIGEPQHLAVCTGENIIHAYARVGKVVEHTFNDHWKQKVVAVYRLKELCDVG